MEVKSRAANSARNVVIGISCQILTLLLSFVSRTVFIVVLGTEYLGVNGLFNSILTVLSLAELGVNNVMIYSLYKPVAEKDKVEVCGLLQYYKKIYKKIAVAVLLIGIAIVPFLNTLVNSDLAYSNLVLYYVLFLINSTISYFVAYKVALINANQKNYIITFVSTASTLVANIIQIIILLTTKSFILYLCIMVLGTILNNIIISVKANKLYPYIKKQNSIAKTKTIEIKENVKSTFIYKIGHVIMNNTDNILISIIIGTVYVGYYSNYGLIVTAVSTFISIIIQAVQPSIGNLNAEKKILKSYNFFKVLLLFFHWLSAFCSLCFLIVFNDFITIWIGESYLLGKSVVIAIVLNFYIQNIINPVWIYRETLGLFNQVKYLMICASVINLFFSVVLGIYWGLEGIILSTALARIFTTVWYEPRLLFRQIFKKQVREYWNRQIKYLFTTIIAIFITIAITSNMPVSLLFIMFKIFICFLVITAAFLITNFKNEEFRMLYGYIENFIYKNKSTS